MTDIVEWLRNSGSDEWCSGQLLKAADEIELLRKALRGWQEWWEAPWEAKRPDIAELRYRAAKAALENK